MLLRMLKNKLIKSQSQKLQKLGVAGRLAKFLLLLLLYRSQKEILKQKNGFQEFYGYFGVSFFFKFIRKEVGETSNDNIAGNGRINV